jgi:hypothetical protein
MAVNQDGGLARRARPFGKDRFVPAAVEQLGVGQADRLQLA